MTEHKVAFRLFQLLLVLILATMPVYASVFSNAKISDLKFRFINKGDVNPAQYYSLLKIRKDERFSLSKIRKSIDDLYKTGQFQHIEVKAVPRSKDRVELIFVIHMKFKIRSIKIVEKTKVRRLNLLDSIFSLRRNTYFNRDRIPDAIQELRNALMQNGYDHSQINYHVTENAEKGFVRIVFNVNKGSRPKINTLRVKIPVSDASLKAKIHAFFNRAYFNPKKMQLSIEKTRKLLKAQHYYFPDISLEKKYLGKQKEKIDLTVLVKTGARYLFRFIGIKDRMTLIDAAWKNKVFEKFAQNESVTKLLNHLYTKGYLRATVRSEIIDSEEGRVKTIVFYVRKGQKYFLNKIRFSGNRSIPDARIRQVINSDKLLYNKLFGFNFESLLVDIGVIELLYFNRGYKAVKVDVKKTFLENKVDIELLIHEGEKNIIDSILFSGNSSFQSEFLIKQLQSKVNGPYVKNIFKRDIESLKILYLKNGYKDVVINYEMSNRSIKSILISINEGKAYKLSDLIVIGASNSQKSLLKKRFPVMPAALYDVIRVNQYKREMENSGIFSSFEYSEILKNNNEIDVIIKVIPTKSKYYGFGLGYEDTRSLRGTVEYQIQNIFNSYSTFSTTLQLGLKEIRGAINYDTPYLFRSEVDASTRIWMEDEIYPSYQFTRFGISESIIKKINKGSYISAAYMWYRTNITEQFGDPSLVEHFNTSALSLLYVIEKRDNPFNPTQGEFFSTTLKVGFPLFSDTVFYKFFWNYQKNWKFLKTGILSLSLRNGFADGDLHISERFFAGGSHTFRGAPNDRLGPINTDYNEPRGGNSMILMNLEASFPINIFPIDNLYYSIFFDAGNIYWDANDFNPQKVEKALGLGIKYLTPMGPLKIEVAWNFRGSKADRFFNFMIGIGNVF